MKPKPIIIPPKSGWKPSTYYLVEASFSKGNPISNYVFYTGFLDVTGKPGSYNEFCRTEDRLTLSDAVFCRAVKLLYHARELELCTNVGKLPHSSDLQTQSICP